MKARSNRGSASLTQRALWIIERNLHGELDLEGLADACHASPYHLSHAFAERLGQPVTEYIRGRRLSFAAGDLAAGAPDILELALTSGYGSHEAFSRAFKLRFGVTPESVRRRRSTSGLPIVAALDMLESEPAPIGAPVVRELAGRTLACLWGRFSFDEMKNIPALWRRFMTIYPTIEGKVDRIPVGVMGAVGDDGWFEYACAVQVRPSADIPSTLHRLALPLHRYAVFDQLGHVSRIRTTYQQIWDRALVENGWTMAAQPGLEFHNSTFDPGTGEGGLTIWIPVVDNQ
jgi:AraC family transcriptional regulator